MTVNRQQIRRDAEHLLLNPEGNTVIRVAEGVLALLAELEQAEETLRFYAEPDNYVPRTQRVRPITDDQGSRARYALTKRGDT